MCLYLPGRLALLHHQNLKVRLQVLRSFGVSYVFEWSLGRDKDKDLDMETNTAEEFKSLTLGEIWPSWCTDGCDIFLKQQQKRNGLKSLRALWTLLYVMGCMTRIIYSQQGLTWKLLRWCYHNLSSKHVLDQLLPALHAIFHVQWSPFDALCDVFMRTQYANLYVYAYAYSMCFCTHTVCVHMCMCMCLHVYLYVYFVFCICMYVYINPTYLCVWVCACVFFCFCMCTCIYMFICTCLHTFISAQVCIVSVLMFVYSYM